MRSQPAPPPGGVPIRQRRTLTAERLLTLLLCAAAALAGSCTEGSKRWNVLVLVPDTIRADHLSVNGYARETSPNLDAFAREGTNFTQAITVAPQTWQSFSSILTGLYPPHHGVRYIFDEPIKPTTPTLATVLQNAGFHTAAFDRLAFVRRMTGGEGFEAIVDRESAPARVVSDLAILDEVWDWLSNAGRPFFAFVRLPGAHWPYLPRPPTVAMFEPCEGRDHSFNAGGYGLGFAGSGAGMVLKDKEAYRKRFFDYSYDDETLRHMTAHYDALIREMDAGLGHLFDRMRAGGLIDQTIIVVTSDHGESLGENGYLQHGPRLDEPVVRVPLIIRLPRTHPAGHSGGTVTSLVRTTDIFPTVLAALELSPPENLDGMSLLPAMAGKPTRELWAYAESGRDFVGADPERHLPGVEGKWRMIRQEGWKLIFIPDASGGEYRLFELTAADGEKHNVALDHPGKVEELRLLLSSVLASEEHRESRGPALSVEQIEQLRALGYM